MSRKRIRKGVNNTPNPSIFDLYNFFKNLPLANIIKLIQDHKIDVKKTLKLTGRTPKNKEAFFKAIYKTNQQIIIELYNKESSKNLFPEDDLIDVIDVGDESESDFSDEDTKDVNVVFQKVVDKKKETKKSEPFVLRFFDPFSKEEIDVSTDPDEEINLALNSYVGSVGIRSNNHFAFFFNEVFFEAKYTPRELGMVNGDYIIVRQCLLLRDEINPHSHGKAPEVDEEEEEEEEGDNEEIKI